MNPATAELDKEQHMQALEPDRVDREEVGRQDLVSMLTQELPPGGPSPKRRRWQTLPAENSADGFVRAVHIQLEQLTLDPPVTPARVLLGQAQDQLSTLGDQTRTSAPGAAGEQ